MLVIHQTQIDAFGAATAASFEREMARHCLSFSPVFFAMLSEEQRCAVVCESVRKAKKAGFTTRGPVRLFLESRLLLGSGFCSDPQYAWIREALGDLDPLSQASRAMNLYGRMQKHQDVVLGPNNIYVIRALGRLGEWLRYGGDQRLELTDEFAAQIVTFLYPEKATCEDSVRWLKVVAERAEYRSAAYEPVPVSAEDLCLLLKVILGHSCFADPLYPQLGKMLQSEAVGDSLTRAPVLRHRVLEWIEHVLRKSSEGRSV